MTLRKRLTILLALAAIPAGFAIAHFGLIAPTPGMFFALGVLACLCAVGIVLGWRDARRRARSGQTIDD